MKHRTLNVCLSRLPFGVLLAICGGVHIPSLGIKRIMPNTFDNGYDNTAFEPSSRLNSTRVNGIQVVPSPMIRPLIVNATLLNVASVGSKSVVPWRPVLRSLPLTI